MELAAGDDDIVAHPSAADILRAIDARGEAAHENEWSILLDAGSGTLLESAALPDGRFDLTFVEKGRRLRASSTLSVEELKSVFTKFLARDEDWRARIAWESAASAAAAQKRAGRKYEPPTWTGGVLIGSVILSILLYNFSAFFSFGDSWWFIAFLFGQPVVTMVATAFAIGLSESHRAKSWHKTTGRIVKSAVEQSHRGVGETEVVNEPAIEFEFKVTGVTYRGTRISMGGHSGGGEQTAATLARYPVGKVVTVYYDRRNPSECTLERGLPNDLGKGCLIVLAFAAALVGIGWFVANYGYQWVEAQIPNRGNAPFVVAITIFGTVALLFFFAFRKVAKQAERWPSVKGSVVESGVTAYTEMSEGRSRTLHKPTVEYAYNVQGRAYRSRQIRLGVTVSGSRSSAEKVAAKYPKGRTVSVRYDPANPGNAALESSGAAPWFIVVAACACYAIAAWAAGLFG